MMPSVDPRTIVLLSGIMGALMSVVLYFLRRNFPPSIKGLAAWATGPAIIFLSTLLVGARGSIPDTFSMVGGNLALFVGLTLLYLGSQRFVGVPPSDRLWGSLILAMAPVLFWFSQTKPHYGMFLMSISVFLAALSISHLVLLLRHGARDFATSLTASALLVLSMIQVARFVFALDLPADSSLFSLTPTQSAIMTLYAFCTLLIPIGLVLMATDKLRAEFENLASHDYLTGALTRRALIEACEQELCRCRRQQRATSLLMLDLDRFKSINDNHGHLVGDQLLRELSATVTSLLRRPDRFGRFGGEEFVVLLPETPLEGARVVAERIRTKVAESHGPVSCTVSIGATTWHDDDTKVESLLARADAALYEAKAAGRNCVKLAV